MATPSVLQTGGKGRKLFEETNSVCPAQAQMLGLHLLLRVQGDKRKNLEVTYPLRRAVGGMSDTGGDKQLKKNTSSKAAPGVWELCCHAALAFLLQQEPWAAPSPHPPRCRSILPRLETFHCYWANKLCCFWSSVSPAPDCILTLGLAWARGSLCPQGLCRAQGVQVGSLGCLGQWKGPGVGTATGFCVSQ